MNDIRKNRLRRAIGRLDLRLTRASSWRYSYDRRNYPTVSGSGTVIFDVGANIGQSALWYRRSFPTAEIYAFEPIPSVFRTLVSHVGRLPNVRCIQKAAGAEDGAILIPHVDSTSIQTVQVLSGGGVGAPDDIEVEVVALDTFARTHGIPRIDILKTDTEGYDLDVIRGARDLLETRRISYILAEASIHDGDGQHTNLFELREHLRPFGYHLCSFFDGFHDEDGTVPYFNALFRAA